MFSILLLFCINFYKETMTFYSQLFMKVTIKWFHNLINPTIWNICVLFDHFPEHRFLGRKMHDSLYSLCKITCLRNLSIDSAYHSQMMDSLSCIANLSLNCSKLTSLPNIDELQQLAILDLSYCEALSQIPIGFMKKRAFPNLQVKFMNMMSMQLKLYAQTTDTK